MRRLVDGLAAWATYHQASASGRHYDEHTFYQHLEHIAAGRGWQVVQQAQVVGQGARGAPSTIDFVFFRRPGNLMSRAGLAFVEVKYLRGNQRSQDLRLLWDDVEKLRGLQVRNLVEANRFEACGTPAKFVLVIGQMSDLEATVACKPTAAGRRKSRLMLERSISETPPSGIYWAEGNTYLKRGLAWRVMAIGPSQWPK